MVKVRINVTRGILVGLAIGASNIALIKFERWLTFRNMATKVKDNEVAYFTAKTFDGEEVEVEMRIKD